MIKSIFFLLVILLGVSCTSGPEATTPPSTQPLPANSYLNLSDTARYVGMQECRACHENIFQTYRHTGMGKSWKPALILNSSSHEIPGKVSDKKNFLEYDINSNDSGYLSVTETSSSENISHKLTLPLSFIVGSGQHTNSHLIWNQGYLWQAPMTWYTQRKRWDLPPGFEVVNSRFSRPIGHECITCHNAYPQPVSGSENKYKKIPSGIDCERCHGPGSIHVALKRQGHRVDTAREIDFSIVNPSKLPISLQMDLCQRCHLQGNAVLVEGKTFYDFRPGMKLSDVLTVFLPRYSDSKENFIMASHADRLKMSACFKISNRDESEAGLRPYRKGMTCITCHNPHVSVTQTRTDYFNSRCLNCHSGLSTSKSLKSCSKKEISSRSNCISCHMTQSHSTDIPHVTIHDHFIRKPESPQKIREIKKFLGLFPVNNPNPDTLTRALGFIQQYEKFENRKEFLDSAFLLLSYASKNELMKKFHALVYYYYVKNEFVRITEIANTLGLSNVMEMLKNINYSNRDAWTAYRIGEAFYQVRNFSASLDFFRKAHELAPKTSSFHMKYALGLSQTGRENEAINELQELIRENPMCSEAYTNLGYLFLKHHQIQESKNHLDKAILLNPNDDAVLLNMAAWYSVTRDYQKANQYIKHLLKIYPDHKKGKQVQEFLKNK